MNEPTKPISIEDACKALGIESVRVVDPYDMKQTEKVLREELDKEGPSVIISRRPCALLKYVKHKKPLSVDENKCVGCKMCMKIGCPAISIVDGKAKIDNTLCVGCGVCEQLCKVGALKGE
jgi:indolepyruvate ferredoxin oxidoreductase alpha subunit